MAGRRTGAHPPLRSAPPAPTAPLDLSDRERAIFVDLVSSVDSAHFLPSDVPLIVAYASAVAQHERAVEALHEQGDVITSGKGEPRANPWLVVQEKAQRAMVALALRLRLSPQARREKAQLPRRVSTRR